MEKQTKQKNKWISFLADGMLSGIMIGIGGVVSLSSDNRYIGALLFSLEHTGGSCSGIADSADTVCQ